jgi:hypothetical protein
MEFANLFQASFAEGIANTLGTSVMETLQDLLSHSIETYAEKPAELHRELSSVFGVSAATLERRVTKELFQRLDLQLSNQLDFETTVNLARHDLVLAHRGNN